MLIKGIRTRRCHETLECSSSSVVRSSTQHGTPRNIIMTFYRGSIQEIHTADSRQCTAVCSDKRHRCFDDTTIKDFRRTSLFVTCTKTSRNASQRHPSWDGHSVISGYFHSEVCSRIIHGLTDTWVHPSFNGWQPLGRGSPMCPVIHEWFYLTLS